RGASQPRAVVAFAAIRVGRRRTRSGKREGSGLTFSSSACWAKKVRWTFCSGTINSERSENRVRRLKTGFMQSGQIILGPIEIAKRRKLYVKRTQVVDGNAPCF